MNYLKHFLKTRHTEMFSFSGVLRSISGLYPPIFSAPGALLGPPGGGPICRRACAASAQQRTVTACGLSKALLQTHCTVSRTKPGERFACSSPTYLWLNNFPHINVMFLHAKKRRKLLLHTCTSILVGSTLAIIYSFSNFKNVCLFFRNQKHQHHVLLGLP